MKIITYITLLLLLLLNSCEPDYVSKYDEIRSFIKNEKYDESIKALNNAKKNYSKSDPNYFITNILLGDVYVKLNRFDIAEKYYKESLNFDYNPYSLINLFSYGDFKDHFNSDRDHISRKLTKNYLKEGRYKEAYETTQLNDSLYNPIGFVGCAFELFEREDYINYAYIECSLGLQDLDKSIKYLDGQLFYLTDSLLNIDESYTELNKHLFYNITDSMTRNRLNALIQLLENHYTEEELNKIRDGAIKNIRVEEAIDYGEEKKIYFTNFCGRKVKLTNEYNTYRFNKDHSILDSIDLKIAYGEDSFKIIKDSIIIALLKEELENCELLQRLK